MKKHLSIILFLMLSMGSRASVYDSIGYPDHVIGRKIDASNQVTNVFSSDFTYSNNGELTNFWLSGYPGNDNVYVTYTFFDYPSMPSTVTAAFTSPEGKACDKSPLPPPIPIETTTYEYQNNKLRRKTVAWNENYGITKHFYYFYDEHHRLFQKEYYSNWSCYSRYLYEYENGNKTKTEYYYNVTNLGEQLSTITTNNYNSHGDLLTSQMDTYNAQGDLTTQKLVTYTYAGYYKTDSIITQFYSDGSWVNSALVHYVYDDKGRIVEYQTGSWLNEYAAWDINKIIFYDYHDEEKKLVVSFRKKDDDEWTWDVFSGQTVFFDSNMSLWQAALKHYSSLKVNQFELSLHYDILEHEFPFLSEWFYRIEMDNGGVTYQHLQYTNDTMINDKKTKVIVRTNQIYDKKDQIEVTHEYIYEQDGKVYWWNKTLQEFTTLYDLTAEVGGEWEIKVGMESIIVHVDEVDVFEYDGIIHKVLRISDANNIFNGDIVLGFGHTTSFFPEKLMQKTPNYEVNGLRCYWVEDALLFHQGEDDCDAIHSGFDMQEENEMDKFIIYPNPTDGLLYVETVHAPSLQGQNEYRITNVMGQVLLQGTFVTGTQQIDTKQLPSGMYFISVGGQTMKMIVR